MTKFNSLSFKKPTSDPFHLQFYKNSCQTIKQAVLQLDWERATPKYMNFYSWNTYIKIRGQPRANLDSPNQKRYIGWPGQLSTHCWRRYINSAAQNNPDDF